MSLATRLGVLVPGELLLVSEPKSFDLDDELPSPLLLLVLTWLIPIWVFTHVTIMYCRLRTKV